MTSKLLDDFSSLVTELNETSGTNAKMAKLIKIGADNAELVKLIGIIWNPNTTTGVTKEGIKKYENSGKSTLINDDNLISVLEKLIDRDLSGDLAKSVCVGFGKKYPNHKELLYEIFEKKPRVRMGATLILQAFPGIFSIFKVALAQNYEFHRFKKEYEAANQKAFISKKYDGVRVICQIMNKGSSVKFYSREGKEFKSLDKVKIDLQAHVIPHMTKEELTDGIVFDGEVMAFDTTGKENFKETVSQIKKIDKTMPNPKYFIFDFMRYAVFTQTQRGDLLEERIEDMNLLFDECPTRLTNIEVVSHTTYSAAEFEKMKNMAKTKGWEGLMIRMNSYYEGKRTHKLMKFKFQYDEEFEVANVIIEEMTFADPKTGGEYKRSALNSVIIMLENKYPVKVGSGFSHEERFKFADNPALIKGKEITVQYQEVFEDAETGDKSLRCPIFKALYQNGKRDI